MKRYLTNSIENMRDIGGYLANNQKLQYGKLIRSNLPNKINEEDLKSLEKMGINKVIDLRSKEEIEKKKSVFENNECFKLFHYKVNGGGDIPESCEAVPISYMNMLEGKETIYNIFKLLADDNGGILYFCNAGKDRTGVITALILMTLGVSKKDIIEDYALSSVYLEDFLNKVENEENRNIKDIITPKKEYMEKFLDYFESKYENINNYLNEIGITNDEINKIKSEYLENI